MPFSAEDLPRRQVGEIELPRVRAIDVRADGRVEEAAKRRRVDLPQPVDGDRHFLPGAAQVLDAHSIAAPVDGELIEVVERLEIELPGQFFLAEQVAIDAETQSQQPFIAGERMQDVLHGPVLYRGHAIECRINAEHPEKFTPSAGKITTFNPPGGTGVRIDTAAYAEEVIPPYYDSLIAKLVVRGKDRDEAISRMSRALEMFIVEGVHTTIPLHRKILADPDFRAGKIDTTFIERFLVKNGKQKLTA